MLLNGSHLQLFEVSQNIIQWNFYFKLLLYYDMVVPVVPIENGNI